LYDNNIRCFAVNITTQQTEAQSLGPVVIELDVVLEQYGPEAIGGRVGLVEALGRSRKRFFGDVKRGPLAHTFEETRATLHWMNTYFDSLQPSTERQRQLLSSAQDLAKNFAQTQMLMTLQLSNPFPRFVLGVVVFWAAALFFGNGLVATPNPVSVGAHLVGAIAISTAIFLILELSQPYSGVVTVRDSRRDAPRSFSLAHTRPPYSVWTSVWPRARSRDGPCAIARRDRPSATVRSVNGPRAIARHHLGQEQLWKRNFAAKDSRHDAPRIVVQKRQTDC
jgi:hypothetical protein